MLYIQYIHKRNPLTYTRIGTVRRRRAAVVLLTHGTPRALAFSIHKFKSEKENLAFII